MSFKDILIESNVKEKLLPDKLLSILLEFKASEINLNIALILSEVLFPGTQGLPDGLAFTNSLPEASAGGAQIQSCFRSIVSDSKFKVNWYEVFAYVNKYLLETSAGDSQPSLTSLTQLFSALDFQPGIIDIFLNCNWWFDKTLIYFLQTSDPQQGGYDVSSLKNLALCFEESINEPSSPRKNILKFINIGKLEVNVMSQVQQQQILAQLTELDGKLNHYLNQVFEHDCRLFTEFLFVAAILIADKTQFISGFIDTLFTLLMDAGSESLQRVILKFKEVDLDVTILKLIDYYTKRGTPEAVNKVLDLSHNAGFFDLLIQKAWQLDVKLGLNFTIDASNFGYDYESVIESKFNDPELKSVLYQSILETLETRAPQDYERVQQQQQVQGNDTLYKPLKITVVFYLLEKLKGSKGLIDAERLKNLQLLLLTTYPRLINFGWGHDEAILKNSEASNSFPSDVEQEMKSYYSKMYNKEVDIKEIVDMLIRMKSSDDPHDQDVFACMIHSLLDEYRFFSEYPLSALASTSLLFGALLEKDLIQGTTLTVALNFIWESCNQPQDSHLFKFAVQSLYNFKSRLHEYPIYCKHLLECQSLVSHAKMYQIVKNAANGVPRTGATVTPTPKTGPRYQSITVSDKQLGDIPQEDPSESVSDKLLFYVNNMTSENMKINEIKELLPEKYLLWFANYMVSDRAKIEPNNHDLYAEVVRQIDSSIFYEYVLNVSLKEAERIIRNFKDSSNDRNNLKNIGAWIGKLTLANDKPLLRDQIALKFLLVEAFDFKSLNLIIPFVCKILDQAQNSIVFQPPNPWVLGILKVLAELYECADLKLNLKFEIEVLLNSFKLKIEDIEPSKLIRSHNPKPNALAAYFGVHPETVTLVNDMSRLALEIPDGVDTSAQQQQSLLPQTYAQPQVQQAQQPQQQQQLQPEYSLDTSFSTLVGNTIFTEHANLRRAFQASLSRAVRECAVPILSRVSEAVLTTTEAMIKKDFACEADIKKFHKSYQTLAQQLAHSMVLCTGRKILSEAIEATMLQLLGNNAAELPLAELGTAIQANVGLCVDIVDKIAADNISELIDERMLKQRLLREQHRNGEPFVEESINEYALNLPPPLGLNPEGITPNQLRIYTEFGTNGPASRIEQQVEPQVNPQLTLVQDDFATFESLFTAITQNCEKSIQLLSDVQETRLADLDPNHPIMTSLSHALTIAQNNALKYPELLLKAAQYAVNCLFTQAHENPMSNEIYVVFLDKLCEFSPSTAKDVTWWLVHSSDQRKFNMPVIYSLLKVQLVQPSKLDSSLGALILESNNPTVVKFAANLLANVFTADDSHPFALRSEFAITLDALSKYPGNEPDEEHVQAKLARDNLFNLLNKLNSPNLEQVYSQMGYIFAEWIKLLTHGDNTDSLQDSFIDKLLGDDILTDPDHFEIFFKAATEISVTAFATEHEVRARTQRDCYLAVDTLAILIVRIILRFEDEDEAIEYLQNIIGIILLVLTNDHEASTGTWNERAYFRLFSSLLSSWNSASIFDKDATIKLDSKFYCLLGEVFNSLQPIIFPGFTFAWISLIAHRMFLPRLVELPDKRGYQTVVKLLTAILKFQAVYSKEAHHDVIFVIFKAVNRIIVGLAHDYPEFLVECHYQLVTAVPREYIQLKNIILSATPSNITVPDPFTQGLKVERLPEINDSPIINYKPLEDLLKIGLKKPVDNFLRIPAPGLMKSIYAGMKLNHPKEVNDWGFDVVHYNVKLVNALVLHVGISAVADRLPNNVRGFNTKTSHVALLVDLMNYGSLEFKFHLINAIANQLRYPNSHTHWFIGIILHFFSSSSIWATASNKAIVQEVITRVLLERRVVSKPHPWGLTIVFTELLKNGDYGFFDLPFVKDAIPELKNIFDALSLNFTGASPNDP
ncbi:uncharacterized protein PRCAT00002118001 [Priceomyces carsonii]|uniref:uncharacterized protein n=1 Tax=Priceomyces carsonii TaxID=28549 RepID=UPI002ED9CE2B|nr:unnamed protein product [Priceomyces carsonii]